MANFGSGDASMALDMSWERVLAVASDKGRRSWGSEDGMSRTNGCNLGILELWSYGVVEPWAW